MPILIGLSSYDASLSSMPATICSYLPNTGTGGSRILVRGARRVLTPEGGPEPKICIKLPENCMILNKY